ncbi:hypothetical protein C8R48DRAFT_778417 [Suillus tomentosus]|nr:hypothetical protein C8R48DRAFT_778417 [Suillus tomentosus]
MQNSEKTILTEANNVYHFSASLASVGFHLDHRRIPRVAPYFLKVSDAPYLPPSPNSVLNLKSDLQTPPCLCSASSIPYIYVQWAPLFLNAPTYPNSHQALLDAYLCRSLLSVEWWSGLSCARHFARLAYIEGSAACQSALQEGILENFRRLWQIVSAIVAAEVDDGIADINSVPTIEGPPPLDVND